MKIIANVEVNIVNGQFEILVNGNKVDCSSATLWLNKGDVPQLDITIPVDRLVFNAHTVVDIMEDDLK